jgi:hypothetical protein
MGYATGETLAYSTRHADQLLHGQIAARSNGSAVFAEGGSDDSLTTVFVLDFKMVLEELIPGIRIMTLQETPLIATIRTTRSRSPS